jgi:hypothetical protein
MVKRFSLTISGAILLAAYSYSFKPIEPTVTAAFKFETVVGIPELRHNDTAQMSSMSFSVNGIHLSCDLGVLSGHGGCEEFVDNRHSPRVDLYSQLRATYFWMPTPLGYHFKVLYSLEQNGILVVPPDQLHAWYMRNYEHNWSAYYMGIWIFSVLEGIFIIWEILSIQKRIDNYFSSLSSKIRNK